MLVGIISRLQNGGVENLVGVYGNGECWGVLV